MRYGSSTRTSECVQVPGKRCNSQRRNLEFFGQRVPDDCAGDGEVSGAEYCYCTRYSRMKLVRKLANTIEIVLSSTKPSPQPKRQIDRFSRFCTAHGRKSLYFTMGAPFPKKFPFTWGESGPHLTHGALPVCCRTGRRCSTS